MLGLVCRHVVGNPWNVSNPVEAVYDTKAFRGSGEHVAHVGPWRGMMHDMMDQQMIDAFLRKAQESLESAESEFANRRYNSCANRCYYACFQALLAAGIGPRDPRGRWGHDYVQATFTGLLVNRRKIYPRRLNNALAQNRELRESADYSLDEVTQKKAERALGRSRDFVNLVREIGAST